MSHFAVRAAFRASNSRQCYIFGKNQYVVLDYFGTKKEIVSGPTDITEGFQMLADPKFENGIDCAFDIDGNEAFIFSKDQCAKIIYAPRPEAKMLIGPIPITDMFPCLVRTPFQHGIDAAIRYDLWGYVLLFKGVHNVLLNYVHKNREETERIARCFSSLYGTVFESGIDAAFSGDLSSLEFYIFKGERCACIKYPSKRYNGDFIFGGRITRISDEWPALHEMFEEEG